MIDYRWNKSTMNSGVCVKGSAYNENEIDYYGILEEVIELQFLGQDNNVFLFKCHWFDPTSIRHDTTYGIVDVKHKSKLNWSDARELAASTQFSVDDINETIYLYKDNEQEEVDPNALEREVESDVEEESRHDEDEVEDDDEDDAELNMSSASDDEYR
ncbi:hypothetical protein Taro_007658, partial [Colocasia esculenta]|nr:hypothetical protein [Colocasia esculenta]